MKRQTGEKSLSCAPLLFLHMLLNFSSGSKTPMQHFFKLAMFYFSLFNLGSFVAVVLVDGAAAIIAAAV